MTAQLQGRPGWLAVLRDLVAFTFPWVLIFKQAGIGFAPPSQVSEPILWLAGAMLGVPGVAQILALRYGSGTGTDGSHSADRPAALSPSAPSSGTSPGADE